MRQALAWQFDEFFVVVVFNCTTVVPDLAHCCRIVFFKLHELKLLDCDCVKGAELLACSLRNSRISFPASEVKLAVASSGPCISVFFAAKGCG